MAMEFDGSSALTVSGWPVPNATTGRVSVSMWWTPANIAGGTQRLWGSGDSMEVRQRDDAGDIILSNDIFEGNTGDFNTTTIMVDDTLYHVVMTGDANNNTDKVYVDGVLEGTFTTAVETVVGTTLSIGNTTGSGDFCEGIIEDWRSYDRILSDEEVETIFAARGIDGIVEGLTGRFMLNEREPGHVAVAGDVKGSSVNQLSLSAVVGTPTYRASSLRFRRKAA